MISSYCFCVWCKSRELGSRGSSRFPCVTPVPETFYSDRVVFSILTNINDGALLHKTVNGLNTLTVSAKCSTTVFRPDSKCGSDYRCCKCAVWVDCKCMEFVATGWCARMWLRLDQAIRNLTSGDLGIPLVVIQVGVTELINIRTVYL